MHIRAVERSRWRKSSKGLLVEVREEVSRGKLALLADPGCSLLL